jgi:hypothetical protein
MLNFWYLLTPDRSSLTDSSLTGDGEFLQRLGPSAKIAGDSKLCSASREKDQFSASLGGRKQLMELF